MQPSRIRVLHLIWRLTAVGGVPAVSRTLLSRLDPERFESHVLSVRPREDDDGLDRLGPHVTVHALDYRGRHTRAARCALTLRMAAPVRAIRPDVLHVHSGSAWMSLPAAVAVPHAARVLDVHDAPFTAKHGRRTDTVEMSLIRRWGYHPVVHSSSVRADTAAALGWRAEQLSLVPLGVESRPRDAQAGRDFRRLFNIRPTEKVVLYTGRAPVKNVPLFVDVARDVLTRFPDGVRFVLIGNQDQAVRDAAATLSPRLLVLPAQPSIVPALEAADVFVSTADYEGFGLAITEAMYTGIPVVSTAVGGVVDQVVDGVTGHLVAARDREALVRLTCALLQDDETRTAMGAAAHRHAQSHFTTARVARDFEYLYDRLLSEGSRRSSPSPNVVPGISANSPLAGGS